MRERDCEISQRRCSCELIQEVNVKMWEGGSNQDDTSRVRHYENEKPSIYSHMHLMQNRSAEIQTSLFCIYGWPNYRPACRLLLLNTLYVCKEIRCICMWNMEWLLCTICPLLGCFLHVPCCLIGRDFAPEKPAVWRWEWSWMGGHRKGWMESGKLLTQDGGSGTWQGALQYAVGIFSQNVNDCDVSICIFNNCQVSVLIIAILYLELKW